MLHPLRETEPGGPAWPPLAERAPPRMDHRIGGRKVSQYSNAMARIILARIENGETVANVVADPDMPSRRTLYDWIRDHPHFSDAWDQMRRDQAHFRRARIAQREQGARQWAAIHARAEDRRPRAKAGRKSTWTPEQGQALCALIARGRTVFDAARETGLANVAIVHRWLRNHPEFRDAYVAACEEREARLKFRIDMLIDRVEPETWRTLKRQVERLEGRIGALRPDIWRWD